MLKLDNLNKNNTNYNLYFIKFTIKHLIFLTMAAHKY